MAIKYGFELEGFAVNSRTGEVVIPPIDWPVDGFPGLVEARTSGGSSLEDAVGSLVSSIISIQDKDVVADFSKHTHKLSGAILAELRRTREYGKDCLDVLNLYGKQPRNVGGKTLASFQINISNELRGSYHQDTFDKDGNIFKAYRPAVYGLLDIPKIVRALDECFASEIRAANRQKGMYSIKDGYRLEYRSLPNFVFNTNKLPELIAKIKNCVEGVE